MTRRRSLRGDRRQGLAGDAALDHDRFDQESLLGHQIRITLPIIRLELAADGGDAARALFGRQCAGECRVGALVTDLQALADRKRDHGHALGTQCRRGLRLEPARTGCGGAESRRVELAFQGTLAHGDPVGESHAEGGKDTRESVHEHGVDAECIGDPTGMLTGGGAETLQRIARDVVAARDRNAFDRIGHVADRDRKRAARDLFSADRLRARRADTLSQLGKTRGDDCVVQGT